jgi:hypothetical protein
LDFGDPYHGPYFLAILIAASTASAPELQKNEFSIPVS